MRGSKTGSFREGRIAGDCDVVEGTNRMEEADSAAVAYTAVAGTRAELLATERELLTSSVPVLVVVVVCFCFFLRKKKKAPATMRAPPTREKTTARAMVAELGPLLELALLLLG